MDTLYVGYAAAGAVAVALILASGRIRRMPVTGPLIALVLGAVLGPSALGAFVVPEEVQTTVLLEAARLLLAISLIGVALRFDVRSMRSVVRPVGVLVGVGMPMAAAVGAALAAMLLGFPPALAALLGACLCPTDPVLASGVVTGSPAERDLPARVRQVLTEESGVNDGLALPLVLVALAPVLDASLGGAIADAAYQVVVAVVVAVPVGFGVGKAVRAVQRSDEVERTPELLITLLMAVTVLGGVRLLNADAILAVFVTGLAYNAAVGDRERGEQQRIDEAFNRYLVVPVFVLLGAVLPFGAWVELGWGAAWFVVGALLLRRLPVVYALRRVIGVRSLDAVFIGWFGPIGVSALFYLVLAEHEGVTDGRLFAAGTLAIAASTVVHGVTTLPGRHIYRRRAGTGSG